MWKLFTVLAWIGGEVVGVFISISISNKSDYLSVLPLALAGAFGGYLIVRAILSNKPDKPEESFEFENKAEN